MGEDNNASAAYVSEVQRQRNFQECVSDATSYSPLVYPLIGSQLSVENGLSDAWSEQINFAAALNVTASLVLYKLLSFSNERIISVALMLTFEWFDPNLNCGATERRVAVETDKVWTPNFRLANPATSSSHFAMDTYGSIYRYANRSGSLVQTTMKTTIDAVCNSMSFLHFPFDSQTCEIELVSSQTVNLLSRSAFASSAASNTEWTVENVALHSDTQSSLQIRLELHRESYYYVLNLINPAIILQSLVALVFILPTEQGAKVKLAATLVLALYVLQESVLQLIPQIKEQDLPEIVNAFRSGLLFGVIALAEGVFLQTLHALAPGFPVAVNRCAVYLLVDLWRCSHSQTRCHDTEPLLFTTCANGNGNGNGNGNSRTMSDKRRLDTGVECSSQMTELCKSLLEELQRLCDVQVQALNYAKQARREDKEWQASCRKRETFKKNVRTAWRRFEYFVNLIGFVACVAVTMYYFWVLFYH